MIPVNFPESTCNYRAPQGLTESQVATIRAWEGVVEQGSLDGVRVTITAWKPTPKELNDLLRGRPVFLTFIGGLPPHYACTDFQTAKSIA